MICDVLQSRSGGREGGEERVRGCDLLTLRIGSEVVRRCALGAGVAVDDVIGREPAQLSSRSKRNSGSCSSAGEGGHRLLKGGW